MGDFEFSAPGYRVGFQAPLGGFGGRTKRKKEKDGRRRRKTETEDRPFE